MNHRLSKGVVMAMWLIAVGGGAGAQSSTFRISQVFSNLSGEIQYVELTESAGLNGQHRLAGLTLTSAHSGVVKRFTFKEDLPTDQTAHMSIVVSVTEWLPVNLIGWNELFGCHCLGVPDLASMPAQFIATDGGMLDFAGADSMTYAALPTDGVMALYRDGTIRRATVPSNGRCHQGAPCEPRYKVAQSWVGAIEYYHAASDHYFISAAAPDIDALDSGRLAGWQRTGEFFYVGAGPGTFPGFAQPVCRFYLPPGEGDSHFLSASIDECEAVRARFPRFILESDATFHATLPDPISGACPDYVSGFAIMEPVYRLWNRRSDANHRYTRSILVRDEMRQRGYMSEGYGPDGVAMCVPGDPWGFASASR